MRGTGFDPIGLGLRIEDLRRHGRGILLDETLSNSDRIPLWTE